VSCPEICNVTSRVYELFHTPIRSLERQTETKKHVTVSIKTQTAVSQNVNCYLCYWVTEENDLGPYNFL